MAFMDKAERDAFLDEIKDKKFNKIRNKVYRADKQARLAYYRNVQESGKWMTRYIMEGAGTQVTVYEEIDEENKGGYNKRTYTITEIVVEPTAENRLD